MSELRRERQAERLGRAKPDFASRVIFHLQKHWKGFLALIGVPSLLDLLKEHVRIKAVDWLLGKLGSIGVWILSYPPALISLGLAAAMLSLLYAAIRESRTSDESTLVDDEGKPYLVRRVSSSWTAGFATVVLLCLCFLGYGVHVYYRTQPLLNEYPLGYVIFDTDTVSGAVTPYETRRGLEAYQFDFRPVRILENTATRIAIELPDVLKDHKPLLTEAKIGGDKTTMRKFGAGYLFSDGSGQIMATGQVLRYEGDRIIWVLGFRRIHIGG